MADRSERRTSLRKEVLGPAIIMAPGVRADCVVRDLSGGGAKIAVSWRIELPEEFDILLLKTNTTRRVSLKWRDGNFAGVQFRRGEAPALDRPAAPAPRAVPPSAAKTVGIKSSWRGRR
jgi:hypothetical protein